MLRRGRVRRGRRPVGGFVQSAGDRARSPANLSLSKKSSSRGTRGLSERDLCGNDACPKDFRRSVTFECLRGWRACHPSSRTRSAASRAALLVTKNAARRYQENTEAPAGLPRPGSIVGPVRDGKTAVIEALTPVLCSASCAIFGGHQRLVTQGDAERLQPLRPESSPLARIRGGGGAFPHPVTARIRP